jgi:hypothetical protein
LRRSCQRRHLGICILAATAGILGTAFHGCLWLAHIVSLMLLIHSPRCSLGILSLLYFCMLFGSWHLGTLDLILCASLGKSTSAGICASLASLRLSRHGSKCELPL